MQTFLPYPSFRRSLECLDDRRLGKQRVEALTILRTLEGGGGWGRHPAVRMWRGYEEALAAYYNLTVFVWMRRGFLNNMLLIAPSGGKLPWWFGLPPFHASHRSNLLRKDPGHYGRFGWAEPPDLPYVWPVREAA